MTHAKKSRFFLAALLAAVAFCGIPGPALSQTASPVQIATQETLLETVAVTMVLRKDIRSSGSRYASSAKVTFSNVQEATNFLLVAKVENLKDKPVVGVQGVFRVYDAAGVEGLRIPFESGPVKMLLNKGDVGFTAGREIFGVYDFREVRQKDPKTLKYVFLPQTVTFADGTTLTTIASGTTPSAVTQ